MNEVFAENRFVLTKALFFEGMRRVWAESSGRSIRRLLLVLGLAWLAFTVYTIWQGGGLVLPAVELLILALVALWAAVWLPSRRAQRAYKAMEERGAAEAERVTRFYEDHLEVETGGHLTAVSYADIVRTLTSKNMLILIAGDKTGILLKRDSFTCGTENEVLTLIQKGRDSHD